MTGEIKPTPLSKAVVAKDYKLGVKIHSVVLIQEVPDLFVLYDFYPRSEALYSDTIRYDIFPDQSSKEAVEFRRSCEWDLKVAENAAIKAGAKRLIAAINTPQHSNGVHNALTKVGFTQVTKGVYNHGNHVFLYMKSDLKEHKIPKSWSKFSLTEGLKPALKYNKTIKFMLEADIETVKKKNPIHKIGPNSLSLRSFTWRHAGLMYPACCGVSIGVLSNLFDHPISSEEVKYFGRLYGTGGKYTEEDVRKNIDGRWKSTSTPIGFLILSKGTYQRMKDKLTEAGWQDKFIKVPDDFLVLISSKAGDTLTKEYKEKYVELF